MKRGNPGQEKKKRSPTIRTARGDKIDGGELPQKIRPKGKVSGGGGTRGRERNRRGKASGGTTLGGRAKEETGPDWLNLCV